MRYPARMALPGPVWWITLAAIAMSACGMAGDRAAAAKEREQALLEARQVRTTAALARTDSGAPNPDAVARWLLPPALNEISGLALTADDRLLAHDDSRGRITEIDYRRGTIVKQFDLGPKHVKADFEGIAVAGDSVFLLASNGKLYGFVEAKDGATVPYAVLDTGLGDECEFEGIAYDPRIESLVLACKIVKSHTVRDSLILYRWQLRGALSATGRLSRLAVPIVGVIESNGWKTVHPSDITVDLKTGNYVIVASGAKALVEITPAGAVVSARPLPGTHAQAEGVAISKDRILIVSDEGVNGPAVITLYRLP